MTGQELLPITKELYHQMVGFAWLMLGPLFLLSCAISYIREPANFPVTEMLHRIVLTIGLLMFFPEITSTVSEVSNALADRVGEKQAINVLFQQIKSQTEPQYQTSKIPFLLSADAGVALINYASYAIVYLVKFLMIVIYHFFWSLLMAIAPIAILCNLFRSTSHITKHQFSSLLEISSWNFLWQVMGVMLLGLNITHPTPGNYFDSICFNFLLAMSMVAAPLLVHSFVRGGFTSPSILSPTTVLSAAIAPVTTTMQAAKFASTATQRLKRSFSKGGKNG